MWDSIIKLIPVSTGLEMLRSGIESIVGEEVKIFDLIYRAEPEGLYFVVTTPTRTIKEPYTGSNKGVLLFAIKNLVKVNMKEGEVLDFAKMHRNEDGTVNLESYVTLNGEKITHSIENYKP